MDLENLLDDFIIEAGVHVDKLETSFLNARALMDDPQMLEDVYRAAHSLKGMAGFFQLATVVALSHSLENILSGFREKSIVLQESDVDTILRAVDCLRECVRVSRENPAPDATDILQALEDICPKPGMPPPVAGHVVQPIPGLTNIPDEVRKNLPQLLKHGQKLYRITLTFDRTLRSYFHHPRLLFENIASVGTILDASCSPSGAHGVEAIVETLEKEKDIALDILVASVLEHDLLVIATELLPEDIRPVAIGQDARAAKPAPAAEAADAPQAARRANTGGAAANQDEIIRLSIPQVNQLLDLSSQLVLARNQLLSTMDKHQKAIPGLTSVLQEISRITSELQDKVMRTRMQPISFAFNRFPRVIRDIARMLGKTLTLDIVGEDVALDKMLIEALVDPLTHIIRNAADHGIEDLQTRARAGKPAMGTIRLGAYLGNNMVTIEVDDDGRGIDVDSVKRAALKKEIITQQEFDTITPEEVYKLSFRQSLSTADQVTNVSGRGIGMDVVKTNVEKLGGTVEIESKQGVGTMVRLRMPRTLAIVPSLIASMSGVLCAVPQMYIEHIVRINRRQGAYIETLGGLRFLCINDVYMPAISLSSLHEATGQHDWAFDDTGYTTVVVIRQEEIRFALMADAVVGLEETLAKPLPSLLRDCFCYSGVTILGSGHAVPILDPVGVARMLSLERVDVPEREKEVSAQRVADAPVKTLVLFQCSGNEYYALPIDEIRRIEAIESGRLQTIGEGTYINLGSATVRVVRPEDGLPVQRKPYGQEKLYLILPVCGGGRVGLLVRKILSHEDIPMLLDETQLVHPRLRGTLQHDEKILLVPRLEEMAGAAAWEAGADVTEGLEVGNL